MNARPRMAIVGSGISGLIVAHHLHRTHDITLFEAGSHVGGHTHTHDVYRDGTRYRIDTGFIVFNERNYVNFIALLDELGVGSRPTSMSFSVACEETGLEYNGTSLDTLFAQRRNLFRPAFYGMVRDILRFYREAGDFLREGDRSTTLGEYLRDGRYGEDFIRRHIVPMGAAVWSSDPEEVLDFPARFFLEFFDHHGFLDVANRPGWRVVEGGSRTYVDALIRPFADRIRLNEPVRGVVRFPGTVGVTTGGDTEWFDEVVFACHSDQALRILVDPSAEERAVLGNIGYRPNPTVLHTDTRLLPRNRRAWASWNYRLPLSKTGGPTVTYNMNILQNLDRFEGGHPRGERARFAAPPSHTFCVTLNQPHDVDPAKVIAEMEYAHPQYTVSSVAARERWAEISGRNRTHYCGAYWGYGFHEDGVNSGLAVVDHIRKRDVCAQLSV